MSLLVRFGFLGVVSLLAAGVHYYLYTRLVRAPEWPARWTKAARVSLWALGVSVPLSFVVSRVLPRAVAAPLSWVAVVWMGVVFFLVLFTLLSELVRLVDRLRVHNTELDSPKRRRFLSRSIAGSVGLAATGFSGVSLLGGLRDVAVKRVLVPIPGLPAALDGLTIVQLSDVHVGPTIGVRFIRQLVETTNALRPDIIAITGDLVDGSVAELAAHVAPLAELRARHGVFFCTGNHEFYSGADEWCSHLSALGVHVLNNRHLALEHAGAAFVMAGVHDWTAGRYGHEHNLARALRGKDAAVPVFLLAHQPKHIHEAAERGVALQLSGHTHGGQMIPFNYLVQLQQPYLKGLHQHRGAMLYVSSGTGYWGPPMRLGVPAEITELRLASV